MHVSQRALDLIANFEGVVLHAYNDPADHCTVGIGHKLHDGPCRAEDFSRFGTKQSPKLTRDQALDLLRLDIAAREATVERLVRVPLNQNEFGALVSFVFNVGAGNFQTSTLLRVLNEGRRRDAAEQLLRWNKGGSPPRELLGLTRRRLAEQELFLAPVAGAPVEPPKPSTTATEIQVNLNRFTNKWLPGVEPLTVDGVRGPATNSRILRVKWYLGYGDDRTIKWSSRLVRRMRHPRDPRFSTPRMIATGIARRRRLRKAHEQRTSGDRLWGGSRAITNEVVRIVGARADITSRKRVATFGNPGSDHHVSQLTADAVDFGIANAQALMDEIARRLGGPSDVVDFEKFVIARNGRQYRVQIIAVTHGTGPHLHVGVRRVG